MNSGRPSERVEIPGADAAHALLQFRAFLGGTGLRPHGLIDRLGLGHADIGRARRGDLLRIGAARLLRGEPLLECNVI